MSGAALRLCVVLLPVLYGALAARDVARRPSRSTLVWVALLVHAAAFSLVFAETGLFPLVIPGAALSALGLAIVAVYGLVEWRSRVTSLSPYVFSGVFVIQVAASVLGFVAPARPPAASPLFVVHVVTTIWSVATLLLSGFFGVMYLVMERQMRAQNFGPLFERLPKLSELAAMNRRAASAGFLMMTVGFNLGIWLAHASKEPGFSYRDPIVIITMATWVVFGVIGLSRWVKALTGRKVAVAAVIGLLLLVLSIAISVIPGVSFHRFD